jgi:23S rRNA G2445 N2-methylase RlmL
MATRMVALAVPGLSGIVSDELRALDGVDVGQYGNDGRSDVVLFERGPDALVDDARTIEDLLVEFGRGRRSDGDNPRWIAGRIWKRERARRAVGARVDGRATFRVIVRVLQERSFKRTALREAFTSLVQRDCPRWRVADPAEIELWVLEFRPGAFVAGVRVSDARMRQHGGRETERRGALRPTVAAAMVRLAGRSRGALLDPCCGSGTILEEAPERGWHARGSDIDPAALRVARRNVRVPLALADARQLPVRDGAVGACVTNLPFGRQYEVEGDPVLWLERVLAELTRVTRPKGRIVVLTPAVPKAALPSALREVRRAPIVLLGTKTTIWSYERR